jgi:fumarate reductase subunit D
MTIGLERRRVTAYRRRPLWLAALVHRISGIALAVFLPLHFLALGLAIEGEARLGSFLKWSEQPLVKFAEAGLVVLLVVHLLGGMRLLVVENLPWRDGQKSLAFAALAIAVSAGVLFLAVVIR